MFIHILQWVFRKILFLKARKDTTLPAYLDRPVTQSIMRSHSMESVLKICDSLKAHFERIEFSNLDRRDAVRSAFLMISEFVLSLYSTFSLRKIFYHKFKRPIKGK